MKKKAGSKNLLKQKAPFKWVSTDIITATSPDVLKGETSFSNYLLIDDGYSNPPKCYGMERINTEEVMGKLDTFQPRWGKIDEFG